MINEDASKKPVQKTKMPRMERKIRRGLEPAFLVDRQARDRQEPGSLMRRGASHSLHKHSHTN
jgi:hypothetical protein